LRFHGGTVRVKLIVIPDGGTCQSALCKEAQRLVDLPTVQTGLSRTVTSLPATTSADRAVDFSEKLSPAVSCRYLQFSPPTKSCWFSSPVSMWFRTVETAAYWLRLHSWKSFGMKLAENAVAG
jgi:hypothetical protein